jgi:hypothetical protein
MGSLNLFNAGAKSFDRGAADHEWRAKSSSSTRISR